MLALQHTVYHPPSALLEDNGHDTSDRLLFGPMTCRSAAPLHETALDIQGMLLVFDRQADAGG